LFLEDESEGREYFEFAAKLPNGNFYYGMEIQIFYRFINFQPQRTHRKTRCDKKNLIIEIKEKEIMIFFERWIILENLNLATNSF